MNCPNCSFDNLAAAKFCTDCGTKLERKCNSCGSEYPEGAKFCTNCGTKIGSATSSISQPKKVETPPVVQVAERRQLTVMFCDLVGSTAISDNLDAEDFRQIILDYQEVSRKVITRYGGHIAQYLGDGLVVYFGYPNGLEDAPTAAVRSALGVLEALAFSNKKWVQEGKTKLSVRIGIHTGLVVMDYNLALGDTTNIAASLEGLAKPNSVVVSEQTYKLIEGWFETKDLGSHIIKGIPTPINLHKVLHESGAKSRLEAATSKGLTPLVGREEEISLLNRNWEFAKKGQGQAILIQGEAGIGKSRLVESIKQKVAEEPNAWLTQIRCLAHYQNTSFYPIIDLLERVVLQFEKEDQLDAKLSKLEGFLIQSGLPLKQSIPVFADLLSLPLPPPIVEANARFNPLNQTPTGRKKRILEAVLSALIARAMKQPVLLIIEDVHWADASTLEWIDLMMSQLPTTSILAITTTRPGFKSNWMGYSNLTLLNLKRLEIDRIEAICMHQSNGKSLPKEVIEQIKEKTDGIPLFVEELTRMVLESGMLEEQANEFTVKGTLQSLEIPSTLKDSLSSRLDKLNTVKELVQIGSVLGREFSYDLLKAVSGRSVESLESDIIKLKETELLYQRGMLPNATFIFKHALIQDSAYDSLLSNRKKLLHERVATVLEESFPELIENKPELLAHHLTEAGLTKNAILHWIRAGQLAALRFATKETVHHLKKGLSILDQMEYDLFRIDKEAEILAILTPVLQLNYGNAETESMNKRWRKAAEATGKIDKIHDAYVGQFTYLMFSTNYQESEPFGRKIIQLGEQRDNDFMYATSLFFYGILQSLLGNHMASTDFYNRAMSLYNPEKHHFKSYYHTGNIKANILTYSSTTVHLLGYPDRALQQVKDAFDLVYQVNQPSSLYANAAFYSRLFQSRKEYDKIEGIALPALKLAKENGDTFLVALLTYYLNTGYAHLGNEQSADIAYQIMTKLYQAYKAFRVAFLVFIADAYRKLGKVEKALVVVQEGLDHIEKTSEGLFVPELYRVHGDLLLEQNKETEAEKYYLKAIDIAQTQADLWHELLATKSLSKYWKARGKTKEAIEILSKVYKKFTEGFETIDMVESKILLEDWRLELA